MAGKNLLFNLGAVVLTGVMALALQYPQLDRRISGQTPEGDRRDTENTAVRLSLLKQLPPSGLGFNNLIASHTFLQFLQYFGDDVARDQHGTGYGLSPGFFEVIIRRDPRFIQAYAYMSASVTIFAGKASKSVELFSIGTQVVDPRLQPYAYRLWRGKATDQLLFLGSAEEARQSYLKAAEAVAIASFTEQDVIDFPELQFVPNTNPPMRLAEVVSRQSAKWLEGGQDLTSAQLSAWGSVLSNAKDEKTLKVVLQELDKIGFRVEVDDRGNPRIVPKS
jgi:hypothetical protein